MVHYGHGICIFAVAKEMKATTVGAACGGENRMDFFSSLITKGKCLGDTFFSSITQELQYSCIRNFF